MARLGQEAEKETFRLGGTCVCIYCWGSFFSLSICALCGWMWLVGTNIQDWVSMCWWIIPTGDKT